MVSAAEGVGNNNDTGVKSTTDRSTSDLVEGFNNLNLVRQIGLMVALAASVAIGFAAVLWTQEEDYRPLYSSLNRLDSSEVIDILEQHSIKFKVDTKTGALLVAVKDVHNARLKLAEVGLPNTGSVGFELLDKEQSLGTSQFMEMTRYRRGLEGELARTITSMNAVRASRVHLAIPKRSVFVRDAREPRASVFLELYPGRGINAKQVRAISNLVASSIPELLLKNVTVVDQKGNLLSVGEEDPNLLKAAKELEYTREVEKKIIDRIQVLLTPIIGSSRFRAEVAADVDFNQVEQAEEMFNPDLAAVRSEQSIGGGPNGIPGALANQPPGGGQAPEQAAPGNDKAVPPQPSNSRSQSTRNFELDRAMSYTRHQIGKVRRLSVAVVVDDKLVTNPETGEAKYETWPDAELERLAILVRDAVGYSPTRGDSVNIVNTPFLDDVTLEADIVDPPFWEQTWFVALIKPIIGLLVILVMVIGLLRPILKTLARTGSESRDEEEAQQLAALEAAGLGSFDELSDEAVTLTGGAALALPGPEESYEQMLNTVKGLVAEDPGRVSQVIKRWINDV
ncbi:flagellar M-ring protein FliF [Candidatus Endobugula sertula]|uniref:Flagellar M-ring protein n=1 Tax=Candidatus Endobugula sertula TaxID=62101 RepID=A0A1D2QM94_9GAMM|nr:flagellar M-ring protein FliF [Candidatus Endobugula sertula]